jgi:DNA-binding MarR family transcriptional regulator/GNAT superfamily N-acetyltransferase
MAEVVTAMPTATQVSQVRAFNRFYTNVIGVLQGMYLGSQYTLTEGRVLFEAARRDPLPVGELRRLLDIDGGYLSRVLGKLEADGLVTRHRSQADARRQDIRITAAGRAAVADLDARAARQIGALLDGVDATRLLDAMQVIRELLLSRGDTQPSPPSPPRRGNPPGPPGPVAPPATRVVLLRPPRNGDLGWVLQRHAAVYEEEFGFNADFEAVCAKILAEFVAFRSSAPQRTAGWIAEVDGVPAGCVFCVPDAPDGDAPGGDAPGGGAGGSDKTARLRLLLVEPWARGLGLGARLVDECLRFAREAGSSDIVLWTYDVLAAARRVYQAAGFTLASEHEDCAFGHHMTSQTWSRRLP